ncbi:MAG: hypothetical protein IPM37_19630 [Hahellaceae bacterium]|nr:hypothetical protein [Hahellaceae bacterium]
MDWYRSALKYLKDQRVVILTDLIDSEGFDVLVNKKDIVFHLLIIDRLLFKAQSRLGNIWRNIVKFLVLPIQVYKLSRFSKKHDNAVYHAHSMYYIWLAWLAGVDFVGTPQGSDILIKPYKSRLYRFLTVRAMKAAKSITVDSTKMSVSVFELSGVKCSIIQNGIDVSAINRVVGKEQNERKNILSMRGFTPLYRIEDLIEARNQSTENGNEVINFIYPFEDLEYKESITHLFGNDDKDLGRLERDDMYRMFEGARAVISIPSSDSSPRSVYEAVFCGAPVIISYQPYYDHLPDCMKLRIVVANLENSNWFDEALKKADQISREGYTPSASALTIFDQNKSFEILSKLF